MTSSVLLGTVGRRLHESLRFSHLTSFEACVIDPCPSVRESVESESAWERYFGGLVDRKNEPLFLGDSDGLALRRLAVVNRTRSDRWHHGNFAEWSVERWAVAMAGEAGEACDAVKKMFRIEDGIANLSEPDRQISERDDAVAHVLEELADTILYADLLAQRLGGSLEEAIVAKFNATSERYGFPERLP